MNEQLRLCFEDIILEQNKLQQIDCFRYMIDSNVVTEFEDVGFCYWNISDNYALLRNGDSLFCNHQAFCDHIKAGDSCYLYWLVCDATQRLTLEKSGYSDYWWALYNKAIVENVDMSCHFAEFCAHRAALYVNPILPHSKINLESAVKNYECLLCKTQNMPEYLFYKVVFFSLMSRYWPIDKVKLVTLCEKLFTGLSCERINRNLVGEWQSFSIPFDSYKQSEIGLNSAINSFIYNNDSRIAKDLYNRACALGMARNAYIESKLQRLE